MAEIQITQIRSLSGSQQGQRRTVRALGLRKMHQSVTLPDRPEIRGMVAKVAHLLEVRYAGSDEVLDIQPGQEPKGEGNPPAGSSVGDDEAAEVAEAVEESLSHGGSVDDIGDLVQNPPTLATTDTPYKPKPTSTDEDAEEDAEADADAAAPTEPDGDAGDETS